MFMINHLTAEWNVLIALESSFLLIKIDNSKIHAGALGFDTCQDHTVLSSAQLHLCLPAVAVNLLIYAIYIS